MGSRSLVLALGLAACGDDSGGDSGTDVTTSTSSGVGPTSDVEAGSAGGSLLELVAEREFWRE